MTGDLIPCSELPEAFHPIACAFVQREDFCAERFPSTARFRQHPDSAATPRLLLSPSQRELLRHAVSLSMAELSLSTAQRQNLDRLCLETARVVVTGQQVGFLGGPFYTALKAMAAVAVAQSMEQQCSLPTIPLFWVEDNDSDGREAGTTVWWKPEGELVTLRAASDSELLQPLATAARTLALEGPWRDALAVCLPQLPEELQALLQSAYTAGSSWSSAFTKLLHWLVAETGMLFLRSSIARQQGLFVPMVERALAAEPAIEEALQTALARLHALGYSAPIVPSYPLLHFHTADGFRYRVRRIPTGEYAIGQQRYSAAELRALFAAEPTAFSPTALLRPLCQDAALPTVAVILGPAEVAYWAELRELYNAFSLPMPIVVLRPSATLVPPAIHRRIARRGWEPRHFLHPWRHVESQLLHRLTPLHPATNATADLREHLRRWYELMVPHTCELEPTLIRSLGATHRRMERALDRWERRLRAALRRRSELFLLHARSIHALLFPQDKPQERLLSWLQLLALCGAGAFRQALTWTTTLPEGMHAVVVLPEEAAVSEPSPLPERAQSPPH